jgi:two-component system copper resistance phosphate regulon response regulator CusR
MLATSEITSSIPVSLLTPGSIPPIGDLGRFVNTVGLPSDRTTVSPVEVTSRTLVIEENMALARLLARGLASDRAAVDVADGIDDADELLGQHNYGVVIVGLDSASSQGLTLLRMIRAKLPTAGVLVLTGKGSKQDMVTTLDHGADDCVAKPFSLVELMARVRALHRRAGTVAKPAAKPAKLVLNREEFRVERSGRRIELTPREFALLEFLVDNPGKALSRSTLMQAVWKMSDDTGSNTNIVDVYMKYLRDKLDCEGEESLIRTVRGVGYVLNQGSEV